MQTKPTMCLNPFTKWGKKKFNFLLITNPVAYSYQYFNSHLQICILQAKGERKRAIAQSPSTFAIPTQKGKEMMQKE
jgi:hypothetical protein